MATIGNLELRINERTLQASTTHDGQRVYEIAAKLVEFLDSVRNPTHKQFEKWFEETSQKILLYRYFENILGGTPDEIIIDVSRKLVLHTMQKEFPPSFNNACTVLKEKYKYQILGYAKPLMRPQGNDLGFE